MYRSSLGQPLARGRTADVYAWEEGWVLKLFHDGFDLANVRYEARIARAVHASGLPVPLVGDLVQVDGRNGLLYKRVRGVSMSRLLQRKPWRVLTYARRLGTLQAQMHARMLAPVFTADVPAQQDRLRRKIRQAGALPAPLQAAVLIALDGMPEGARICHGDFHPGNVLLTTSGEVIIDWIDATRGNPLADVARTTIILLGAVESGQIRSLPTRALVRLFHAVYVRDYFSLRPEGREEYRRWLPIVAAARLSEGMPELTSWLISRAQEVA
jgi:aminoglycoside phosphotransferase (APT) family kinase protein